MNDERKTKQELIRELKALRRKAAKLERAGKASLRGSKNVEDAGHKKTEEALAESEHRFRLLAEAAFEGIAVTDQGVFVDLSGQLADMLGYRREELIGKPVAQVIAPESQKLVAEAHRTRRTEAYEHLALRKDGTMFLVEVRARFTTIGSRPLRVTAIRDISRRRQIEDRLRSSEERFSALVKNSTDHIAVMTADGVTVYNSPSVKRILGYESEELIGRNTLSHFYIHPDDLTDIREKFRALIEKGGVATAEYRFRHAGGSWVCLNSIASNHLDDPAIQGIIINSRDITERKQAEEMLRSSGARLSKAEEIAHVGSWELDLTADRLSWSDEVYRIFGLQPQEFGATYEAFLEAVHPDDRALVHNAYSESVREGRDTYEIEHRVVRKSDGCVRTVHEKCEHIRDASGRIIRSVGMVHDVTERRQAEEQLRSSEKKYRNLIETTETGFVILDGQGRVVDANLAYVRMTGNQALSEIIGRRVDDWTAEYEREKNLAAVRQCLERGFIHNLEIDYAAQDGRIIPVEINATVVRSGAGVQILSLIRDITERRMAEAERERLTMILEMTTDLVSTATPDGRLTYLNRAGRRMAGWGDQEQLEGSVIRDLHPQWALDRIMEEGIPATMEKGSWQGETAVLRRDGAEVPVSQIIVAHRSADGELQYLSTVMRDMTEQKLAEKKLRLSEKKFRDLAELLPQVIFEIDLDGRFTYGNPFGLRLFGYAQEELERGLSTKDVIVSRDWQRVAENTRKIIQREMETGVEYTAVRKNGEEFPVMIYSTPVMQEGQPVGLRGIVIDITERKKLEAALVQSQKMEAIGTLAGGIAHDFNNLLMAIQGNASLMRLDLKPGHPHYERLQNIEDQIRSGADLTRQLLGFARGGRYDLKPADMNEVVEKTATMFGRTKKEITVYRNYQQDLWAVETDRGQMEQVFMNLFVNAWQAMPGGGHLFLETRNTNLTDEQAKLYGIDPGRYVHISIADTGVGMDEKTRERIFDPFFTTKGMGRGTGLGLAMVYGIIRGHEGAIEVRSEPGRGTTFDIYLPASDKAVTMEERTSADDLIVGTGTVLVVDDEPDVLAVSRDILEFLGYSVIAVASGREALAAYGEKKDAIELVVLDMIMPGISGGETFDLLREINPDVKVILSSGYSIDGMAREIIDRGCNGFLQKPFDTQDLSKKIQEVLGG